MLMLSETNQQDMHFPVVSYQLGRAFRSLASLQVLSFAIKAAAIMQYRAYIRHAIKYHTRSAHTPQLTRPRGGEHSQPMRPLGGHHSEVTRRRCHPAAELTAVLCLVSGGLAEVCQPNTVLEQAVVTAAINVTDCRRPDR